MNDDRDTFSDDQEAALKIMRTVREEIFRRLPEMPGMSTDQLKVFVDTANQVIWMNEQAGALDRRIEKNGLPWE